MTRARDPFLQALSDLTDRLTCEDLAGGGAVVIAEEAARLKLSPTPVREALAYLHGEGLVYRGVWGGYLAPRLDAAAVRDRYSLQRVCLLAAAEAAADQELPPAPTDADPLRALEHALDAMLMLSGNPLLLAFHQQVRRKLGPLRAAERRAFPDHLAEAKRLVEDLGSGARREVLDAYCRRRLEASARIAADLLLRTSAP